MRIPSFFLLALVLAFCCSCAYVPMPIPAEDVPLLEEVVVGQKLFPWAVQKMGGSYPDGGLLAYVERVGRKLEKHSGRSEVIYHFQVVNSSSPGGFAFPGGYIGISRGLLMRLENEAQLAAVMAHLMAHVEDYHLNDALRDSEAYSRIGGQWPDDMAPLSYDRTIIAARDLTEDLLAYEFTLRQERDADRIAVGYLAATGYDPRAILWLMDIWSSFQGRPGRLQAHRVSRERWIIAKRYVDNFLYTGKRSRFLGEEAYAGATAKLREYSRAYDYFDQGMAQEKEGDLNAAVALYLKAAAEADDEPLILCRLGLAYLKAEDRRSAGRYLRQAVRRAPDYYNSRLGMGYSLLEDGQTAQAVVHLQAGMRLLPTIEGAFLLAEAYERQGQAERAATLYADVARAEPGGRFGRRALERRRLLAPP